MERVVAEKASSFTRLLNLTMLKLGECGRRGPPDLTCCGLLEEVYLFKVISLEKFPNLLGTKEVKEVKFI